MDEVHDWLEGFRHHWESRFNQLDTVLAGMKAAKKSEASKAETKQKRGAKTTTNRQGDKK